MRVTNKNNLQQSGVTVSYRPIAQDRMAQAWLSRVLREPAAGQEATVEEIEEDLELALLEAVADLTDRLHALISLKKQQRVRK